MELATVVAVSLILCYTFVAASDVVQANVQYPECPDVPTNWTPDCPKAVYARIQLRGNRRLYWSPFTSDRWGNALSPYWQARAIAELAGHGFSAYSGFTSSWLQYLPKELPPDRCPNATKLNIACSACDPGSWEYAHRCSAAWQFIRPTIIKDTHAAVNAWAAATNRSLPAFLPGDTVIQSRCNRDTLLDHDEYGPVGFSYYDNIKPTARNIYIITDPRVKLSTCTDMHAAQVHWLEQRFPNSKVQLTGGDLESDFLRLLLAPVLFRDSQSSFGLWAGMANKGEVWSVPLLARFSPGPTPDFGQSWHWVDTPVLYPETAIAANISKGDMGAIINWLQTH